MDSKLSKTIGIRINTLLAEQGHKQKELAAHLGIQDNTISYFVSGRRTPNTEQIVKIADFFNVSADYLLGRTTAKTTDKDLRTAVEYTMLSEKSCEYLHNFFGGNCVMFLSYFNYLTENEIFTEIAMYLERYAFNSMMKDFTGLGEKQNRENREKSDLILFYVQEFIKDSFKKYIKDGE